MCYSALVKQGLAELERRFLARIDRAAFRELFNRRLSGANIKVAKALEEDFGASGSYPDAEIAADIAAYRSRQAAHWEQELFKQRARRAKAQRANRTRPTKKSQEDERIAGRKVDSLMQRLADLRRREPHEEDARVFPMYYAPVVCISAGERIIRPMRYTCRLASKPASYDARFPGTYNARRDHLSGFWAEAFGTHHAIMVVSSFYENVSRAAYEKRETASDSLKNVVLQFKPSPPADMMVACLWSHWEGPNAPPLDSFAAITDEPPAEIAATGHNRCIVALRPESIDAWLQPRTQDHAELQRILDARPLLSYEHLIAA